MVLVAFKHTFCTVDESLLPFGLVGEALVGFVAHAVAFDVGLVHYIHAVDVAQFIPARVVGVVGGAHAVDVVLFHQFQVAYHGGFVHYMAVVRVVFVAVYALDVDGLPVDE